MSRRRQRIHDEEDATVSLVATVPEPLAQAMQGFIERHPHWDHYRLFQAALAGFLVQHGAADREVTRWYLAHLFPGQGGFGEGSAPIRLRPLQGNSPSSVHHLDQAA
ncbi:MAG: DUF2811 domain-containing protein [Cyanobacteriota bacterium]|nr:DUF2811 domain-containing protein [Cyanobacteriota bacterium]